MVGAVFVYIAVLYTFCRVCYMDIANYYIYVESCSDLYCYAVKGINVSYNTENQNIFLLCAAPVPLDKEETLPRAEVKVSTTYESDDEYTAFVSTDDQPCNDTNPLLLEYVSGESHAVRVSIFYQDFDLDDTGKYLNHRESFLRIMIINFQTNGSVNIIWNYDAKQTDLTFNETSSLCSTYEDVQNRACFCKENHAREFCLDHTYKELDMLRNGSEYYHIYGMLIVNSLRYYYYFGIYIYKQFSRELLIQRNIAAVFRETGGNESVTFCVSYNGSVADVEYRWKWFCNYRQITIPKTKQNFTAFVKFHDNKWHSLLWFDYLRWSKSYIPGNCSYEEQVLDGVVHPFAICMRRNITEKFYKNITQGDQTSSTLRITTDYSESVQEISQVTRNAEEPSLLLNQEDIEESFSRIAEMRNISKERRSVLVSCFLGIPLKRFQVTKCINKWFWIINNVLSTLDTFLNNTTRSLVLNSSGILQSLSSIVMNSCCDIDFIGDWALVVQRHTVSCLETDPNDWPALNEIPKNSNFGYHDTKNKNYASIEIINETVCGEGKHQEYIVIYYLFSNQMLFVGEEQTRIKNACELRKQTQQNFPVMSAQLVDKLSMETIHQIDVHKEYKPLAKIMFPGQPAAKLHGSTKLVYWQGETWIDAKVSKMTVENDRYVYVTNHLTDFTLVVDGLEMDPILCDVALDSISVIINFLSFVGLIILIGHLSIKRYLSDCATKKGCGMDHKVAKLPSKYEKTRLNYFVVLALFHLGFLLLSDSRDLFWPMSCDIAAVVLYWLLLTCILITIFQSLHIFKILVCNSSLENLLINAVGRKFVLFVTLSIPTTIVLILKTAVPLFFDREDYFCWIRPDYVVPAVILPLGFLGLNSAFIFCIIFVRIVSQGSFFGIYVTFGQSSVRTIISTSTASTRSVRSNSSSASLISNGAKYVEKAFTLLCIQLMLGVPWICQYLTLFAPQLTAAHYIFTIVIGSQGLMFFMLFCYRKIKKRYF